MDREDGSSGDGDPSDSRAEDPVGALEAALTRDEFGEEVQGSVGGAAGADDLYLVFVLREALFAVHAPRVESVVSWREPVALPGSAEIVHGVIQDRGRVIAVLRRPDGTVREGASDATRILICPTALGFVGLPASRTFAVAALARAGADTGVVDTALGPATHVEPDALAARIASR